MPNGRSGRFVAWSFVAAVAHPFAVLGLVVAAIHVHTVWASTVLAAPLGQRVEVA
ncbi:MAG: hypothetical protein HOV94_31040 [Saccharothrix sp.]|nr:hypothetical protein [Saccharothrix sp.]